MYEWVNEWRSRCGQDFSKILGSIISDNSNWLYINFIFQIKCIKISKKGFRWLTFSFFCKKICSVVSDNDRKKMFAWHTHSHTDDIQLNDLCFFFFCENFFCLLHSITKTKESCQLPQKNTRSKDLQKKKTMMINDGELHTSWCCFSVENFISDHQTKDWFELFSFLISKPRRSWNQNHLSTNGSYIHYVSKTLSFQMVRFSKKKQKKFRHFSTQSFFCGYCKCITSLLYNEKLFFFVVSIFVLWFTVWSSSILVSKKKLKNVFFLFSISKSSRLAVDRVLFVFCISSQPPAPPFRKTVRLDHQIQKKNEIK